jgi:hypothetical protein
MNKQLLNKALKLGKKLAHGYNTRGVEGDNTYKGYYDFKDVVQQEKEVIMLMTDTELAEYVRQCELFIKWDDQWLETLRILSGDRRRQHEIQQVVNQELFDIEPESFIDHKSKGLTNFFVAYTLISVFCVPFVLIVSATTNTSTPTGYTPTELQAQYDQQFNN